MSEREQEIDILCRRLKEAWLKVPDLRLGQLMCNAVLKDQIFYKPDREFIREVEKVVDLQQ